MTEETISCPHCGTKFDIKSYLDHLRDRLFKKIDKIIEEMKNA